MLFLEAKFSSMGKQALQEMAEKNGGKITCPRTGDVCNFTELVKAFIS